MTIDRIINYAFTAGLVIFVGVLVWRHQHKAEPPDQVEKKR